MNFQDQIEFMEAKESRDSLIETAKLICGAAIGCGMLFGFMWAGSIMCVALGGSVSACGM